MGAEAIDKAVTLWINGIWTPLTDPVWSFVSGNRVWFPAYILLFIFILKRFGWKNALMTLLAAGVTVTLCDQAATLVKNSVERLRPCFDTAMLTSGLHVTEAPGKGMFGFFSAHAANAFGLATVVTVCLGSQKDKSVKDLAAILYTWAALVSVSRIMVGKHFAGDVLVGALFGTAIALAAGTAARAVIKSISSRNAPVRERE